MGRNVGALNSVREIDAKLGEKPAARLRNFSGFVTRHDVLVRNAKIDEVHAETTRKVVVAGRCDLDAP